MLSERPWKAEAILRLFLSVFVCHFLGSVVAAVVGFVRGGAGDRAVLFYALVAGSVGCSVATLWLLRRPWQWDGLARRFVFLLFCLYAGLTLGALAQHVAGKAAQVGATWRTVLAAVSFQGLAILLVWRFVREHQTRWGEAFGFRNAWGKALIYGAFAACVFLPLGMMLQYAASEIMSRFRLDTPVQPAVQALASTVTWLDRAAIGIAAIGIAPVAEELLFRGILYPGIKQAGYPRLAFWGTSFVFAVIHLNLPTFVPLFLLALALTWLYEKTDNLLAPVVAHTLFNAMNFLLFYSLPWAEENFRWLTNQLRPS